jgi:hypothetical protein
MTYRNFNESSSVAYAPTSVCFEEQQLRTLEETVLRTGCILTTGHPLQVNSGKHAGLIRLREAMFTA